VKREAAALGTGVTGSEVVGLIPKEALLLAGAYYAGGASPDEGELIARAIGSLGLSRIEPFDPAKKIIEFMI
jgi:glutamate formiminotransferase/formiminotetrahydrofolate cyclodeaminase